MQDLTTNIHKFDWSSIDAVFISFWLFLITMCLIKFIASLLHLVKLKRNSKTLNLNERREIYRLIEEHNLSHSIQIMQTEKLQSPVTFWLGKYYILIPKSYFQGGDTQNLKYIFLHEYAHAKNKHTSHLIIFNILSIVMSYNPLVFVAKKIIVQDNEVEADLFVLKNIEKFEHRTYAETVFNSALKSQLLKKQMLVHTFSGTQKTLKKRLLSIRDFKPKKASKKIILLAYVLSILSLVIQCVFLTGNAAVMDNYKEPLKHEVQKIDEIHRFSGNKGSFVMYSVHKNKYYIFNENESRVRYSPDSTFKLYLALFGLDNKVISKSDSYIQWNDQKYPFKPWNKDQTLNSAMKNSVNWYFEDISKQLPKSYVTSKIKQLNYGNQNLGNSDNYWMENSLKVSNLEQVLILSRVMEDDDQFHKSYKSQLSSSLLLSDNSNYKFYGKTGTGLVNGESVNGWFLGYVKTKDDTFYFSTHISGKQASGKRAKNISEGILKEMSVINDK
jgi:bla regulator protein BlaR1